MHCPWREQIFSPDMSHNAGEAVQWSLQRQQHSLSLWKRVKELYHLGYKWTISDTVNPGEISLLELVEWRLGLGPCNKRWVYKSLHLCVEHHVDNKINWQFVMLYGNPLLTDESKDKITSKHPTNHNPIPKQANQTNQTPSEHLHLHLSQSIQSNLAFNIPWHLGIHRQIPIQPSLKYPYYNTTRTTQPDQSRDTKNAHTTHTLHFVAKSQQAFATKACRFPCVASLYIGCNCTWYMRYVVRDVSRAFGTLIKRNRAGCTPYPVLVRM